jgi:hypothetical protein
MPNEIVLFVCIDSDEAKSSLKSALSLREWSFREWSFLGGTVPRITLSRISRCNLRECDMTAMKPFVVVFGCVAGLFLALVSAVPHAAAQMPPAAVMSSDESKDQRVADIAATVSLVAPLTGPPEMAVSSATDAATAANFEFLSWYSDGYYNEYYRFKAAREASKGDWGHAARLFEMAARYGDKYSQHRLSLIYWHGVGAAKDRVEAYVWADLAAERGYPSLLAIREKMWSALTPQEREAVPERGKRRFAKYGDAAAMSLFRGMLARQRARHFLLIRSTVPSKLPRYYPESYLAQETASWKKIRIDIGDIEKDATAKTAPVQPLQLSGATPSPANNEMPKTSKPSPY